MDTDNECGQVPAERRKMLDEETWTDGGISRGFAPDPLKNNGIFYVGNRSAR